MRGPKVRLRGLSEIATNPPRLILAEQLGCRAPVMAPGRSMSRKRSSTSWIPERTKSETLLMLKKRNPTPRLPAQRTS